MRNYIKMHFPLGWINILIFFRQYFREFKFKLENGTAHDIKEKTITLITIVVLTGTLSCFFVTLLDNQMYNK